MTDVAEQAKKQAEGKKALTSFKGLSGGQIQSQLNKMAPMLEKVLMGAMNTDQVIGAWLTILNDPKSSNIAACSPQSVFGCMIKCAVHGLSPSPHRGEVALIPRKNILCFQPMYRGVIKETARNNPNITKVYARVVKKGDEILILQGTEERIEHRPRYEVAGETEDDLESGPDRPMAYAVIQYADGTCDFETMSKAQVNHVRDTSSKKDPRGNFSDAWTKWYGEKAKITVMLRLMKRAMQYVDERTLEFLSRAHDIQNTTPEKALKGTAEPVSEPEGDPVEQDGAAGGPAQESDLSTPVSTLYEAAAAHKISSVHLENIWTCIFSFDLPIVNGSASAMNRVVMYILDEMAEPGEVDKLQKLAPDDSEMEGKVDQLLGGLPWRICSKEKIAAAIKLGGEK
jgi:recombination protein RecT